MTEVVSHISFSWVAGYTSKEAGSPSKGGGDNIFPSIILYS